MGTVGGIHPNPKHPERCFRVLVWEAAPAKDFTLPPLRQGAHWSPVISALDEAHARAKALELWPDREVVSVHEYRHAGQPPRPNADDLDA